MIFAKTEKIIPFVLPINLLFFRGLADVTVVIIVLLFLYKSYSENDWQWIQETWFQFSLLFWAYLLLLNAPSSLAPIESFAYATAFIRWPIFAIALSHWIIGTVERQRHFIIALFTVSLFVIADTIFQHFNGTDFFGISSDLANRLTGPFRNPLPGTLMLRVLFILPFACVLIHQLSNSSRCIMFTTTILAFSSFFFFITGERMPFVMFCSGSALIFLGMFFSFPQQRKIIIGSIFLLIALLFFTTLTAPITAERTIYSFFRTIAEFDESPYGQIFIAAYHTWDHNPVLGAGLHTYREACDLATAGQSFCGLHPHNIYVQLAAETGIFGVIFFLLMLASIIHSAILPLVKAADWFAGSISLTILGVTFWPLMASPSLFNNWVAGLVWLGIGVTLVLPGSFRQSCSNQVNKPTNRFPWITQQSHKIP